LVKLIYLLKQSFKTILVKFIKNATHKITSFDVFLNLKHIKVIDNHIIIFHHTPQQRLVVLLQRASRASAAAPQTTCYFAEQ
jgi:hypothetical protein